MAAILECVPNISEGRDLEKVEKILDEVRNTKGVKLLDYSSDKDHNRSVITFLGEPEAVIEAAYKLTKKATELIDMTTHTGGHPRMGAVDVIPLIPIKDITIEEAVELSKKLGEKIGSECNMHVTLYESSASAPHRTNLADVRRGQYEGMEEKIKEEKWIPDYGPQQFNVNAGIVAVGARPPLVAYNINLATSDVKIAKNIANVIRAAKGGFVYCKAMGLLIEETGKAQVSMNLVNPDFTTIFRVFDTVEREAARYGVAVTDSEIVGLVPMKTLIDTAIYHLKLDNFSMDQVLETRIWE
ncbi:glutamate formiminotransferase [Acetoanaerobium pronyense]|uniref:glutamate formimidoyltransferase n=1 Tax=Acetoanaerobium pronyense TaxID=1482736 RepID=A0ABS4KGY5_9FIRM|nr:glutamate formimidoyltransferase [Acetoanaerobium pronyense]MBP2027039.1 glutamate formiminotransferase [Acetoanaerobium pronyense]